MTLGNLTLRNRVVMAPMTRSRSSFEGVPSALNATYYGQRAAVGLTITEGTQPSADGQRYSNTPGIFNAEQIAGWRPVTNAVHAAGGRIFVQLMHCGRIAHPDTTPHHRKPVAPSAVKPAGKMFTPSGPQDMPVPRELTAAEVEQTIGDFRHAARCAVEAGADGVEIHAANGYIIHQFLSENANRRTDAYGGSIENRVRFAAEVAKAIVAEIGAERTGIHVSPGNPYNDIVEGDTTALYHALVNELAPLELAYLHPVFGGDEALLKWFRAHWPTAIIVNRPDRPREKIAADIEAGIADAASLAQFALANPDLIERLETGAPFNVPDKATFYSGGAHGYTDYPAMGDRAT